MKKILGGHAIVLGGSMAGLLAARVLSDHFARVTLIERDSLSLRFEARKGVPQGRHAHALLARGQMILEALFQDIVDEWKAHGAVVNGTDVAATGLWHQYGYTKAKFDAGMPGMFLSRPKIEGVVRNRVMNLANVTGLPNCDVLELISDDQRSRIIGVRIADRDERQPCDLHADLVIDATGRGSKSPQWLKALGYDAPAESVVKVDLAYATRQYRRSPGDLSHIIAVAAPPHGSRGCAMLAMEDDRAIVTLFGYMGDHPPTDDAGFLEFARSLPTPAVYDRIKNAQPLTEVVVHKFPANLRRHYEKLSRMPERYLVIGDAVCSFNPVYGQGMSVSAMEAEALQQTLAAANSLDGLRAGFYKRATPAVEIPWTLASGADLAYAKVEGARNPVVNLINAYVAQIHAAASVDELVAKTFFEVANFLKTPDVLFKPGFVLRTLLSARRARRADAVHGSHAKGAATPLSPAGIAEMV